MPASQARTLVRAMDAIKGMGPGVPYQGSEAFDASACVRSPVRWETSQKHNDMQRIESFQVYK